MVRFAGAIKKKSRVKMREATYRLFHNLMIQDPSIQLSLVRAVNEETSLIYCGGGFPGRGDKSQLICTS